MGGPVVGGFCDSLGSTCACLRRVCCRGGVRGPGNGVGDADCVPRMEAQKVTQSDEDETIELARIAFERGAYRRAERLLLQAIEHGDLGDDVWNNLGTVRVMIDDYAGAVAAYANSSSLGVDSLANLGLAYERLGDIPGAFAKYEEALTLDPDHVSSLVNLGTLLLSEDRVEEAQAVLLHAADLDPSANWQLSDVYIELGDLDSSSEALHHAIAAGERRGWLDLARVEHDRGNRSEAELAFAEAIAYLRAEIVTGQVMLGSRGGLG